MAVRTALLVLSLIACVYATSKFIPVTSGGPLTNHGSMTIEIEGQSQTVYVVSAGHSERPNKVSVGDNGNSFTMNGGAQVQITASEPGSNYDSGMFQNFSLLGKRLTYTTDLANVGCSCNTAFYFVSMPAFGQDQNADSGKYGDYYCDANKVGGEYCPEMDVSEANKYTMATTPHKCTSSQGKHWWWCDGAGCGQNVHNANPNAMCPGSNCTINTNNAYTHAIEFQESNGQLSGIKNTLTQGSQSFIYYSCTDSSYLQAMTDHLKNNMVLVMSQWGNTYQTMQWLDGMTGCQGDCDLDGASSTYSDIKINTL